uniref:Uncharacterized protein n=1 Tax=Sphaerodactylus townsendi TaxID=933632 RepID=A0ACB8FSU7_9SAUR
MGRFLALVILLLLLSVSTFCFSAGEKDHGFHIRHVERKLSRSELGHGRSGLCPCPGYHRSHSHGKNKHFPHRMKQKCKSYQRHCQHRTLMGGLQIPL